MPLDTDEFRINLNVADMSDSMRRLSVEMQDWVERWQEQVRQTVPPVLHRVSSGTVEAPTFNYTVPRVSVPVRTHNSNWLSAYVDTVDDEPQPARPRTRPRPQPLMDYEAVVERGNMLQLSPTLQSIVYDSGYDNRICHMLAYDRYRLSTERMNYLDVDGDRLTYMPANRVQEEYPDGTWKPTGRQSGRPAKIIRSLMSDDVKGQFSDKDFEVFANIVKSYDARSRGTFDLVEGTDIVKLYNEDAYMDECGSMAASCMRYEGCEDYFGIYAENPAIIKMLVLRDKKRKRKIHGRALVWFVPGFETPIMDRVYGNDHTLQAFRAYAVEQGWYYRAYNTYSYEQYFIKDGESVRLKIRVALPSFRYDLYPYMDTMKFFDSKTGEFSNYETSSWCSYLSDIHGHEDIPHRWYNHPDGYKKAFSQVEIVASNPVQKRTQERAYILDPLPDEEPLPFAETLSEDDYDLWLAESRLHRLEEVLLEP